MIILSPTEAAAPTLVSLFTAELPINAIVAAVVTMDTVFEIIFEHILYCDLPFKMLPAKAGTGDGYVLISAYSPLPLQSV